MHFTGAAWKANVGEDPELVARKVTPALEVVTHSGLNRNLSFADFFWGDVSYDIWMREQLHNPLAYDAPHFASILVIGQLNSCCAKVIPGNLIIFFALSSLRDNPQAQNIVLLGDGGDRKLHKINALVTIFTRDVAIQLKSPSGYDGAISVEDHPHGSKGNAH